MSKTRLNFWQKMQVKMNKVGILNNHPIDSKHSMAMKKALFALQRKHGLHASGNLDSPSIAVINKMFKEKYGTNDYTATTPINTVKEEPMTKTVMVEKEKTQTKSMAQPNFIEKHKKKLQIGGAIIGIAALIKMNE